MHVVHFFHRGQNLFTLRQQREIAYQHIFFDTCVERRQYAAWAYGLQHRGNDAKRYILARGIAARIAKKRCRGRLGQVG